MIIVLLLIVFGFDRYSFANESDSLQGKLTTSAYFEAYYGSDESGALSKLRPDFLYNYSAVNRPAINLTYLKSSFTNYRFNMNVAFMAGTYVQENMAPEDQIFRNLLEANFAIGLNKKENVWIQAGVFPSHIGMESVVGWDNPTLTRCLVAENSPYYESGIKLSWKQPSGKWYLALLGLNGWQRISVSDEDILPGAGTQIIYTKGKLKINYSTFFGDISPQSDYKIRFYQDLFAVLMLNERMKVLGGFDLGYQQQSSLDFVRNYWYSWFGILQFKVRERATFAFRAEQFVDPQELLIVLNSDLDEHGTALYSFSVNGDYLANDHLMFRLEMKFLGNSNEGKIVYEPRNLLSNYFGLTASVCAGF